MHKLIATIVLSSSVILCGAGMAQSGIPLPMGGLFSTVNPNADLLYQVSEQQLATAAADEPAEGINFPGYRVYNVIGDGNCFYRALAHQLALQGVMRSHEELRNEIFAHIRGHMGDYRSFVANPAELEQIARDHNWSGELEIQAAADALGVAVILHNADGTVVRYEPNGGNRSALELSRPLEIGYNGVNHFVSLIAQEAGEIATAQESDAGVKIVLGTSVESLLGDIKTSATTHAEITSDVDSYIDQVKKKIGVLSQSVNTSDGSAWSEVIKSIAECLDNLNEAAKFLGARAIQQRMNSLVFLLPKTDSDKAVELWHYIASTCVDYGLVVREVHVLENMARIFEDKGATEKSMLAWKLKAELDAQERRLYDAACAWQRAAEIYETMEIERFACLAWKKAAICYKEADKPTHAICALKAAARAHEQIGQLCEVARMWEWIAEVYKNIDDKKQQILEAWQKAAISYEQVGQLCEAARVLRQVVELCKAVKKTKLAIKVWQKIAECYNKAGILIEEALAWVEIAKILYDLHRDQAANAWQKGSKLLMKAALSEKDSVQRIKLINMAQICLQLAGDCQDGNMLEVAR